MRIMKTLILLHGALGSREELKVLEEKLSPHFNLHLIEFEGHGQSPLNGEFSIPAFAAQVSGHIQKNNLAPANLFGYSMGGYVALYLASEQPNLIDSIITLGTKFNWTPESALKETRMLNPDVINEKVPKFGEYLSKLHGKDNWKVLLKRTADLMISLGDNELLSPRFSAISNQCFLGRGSLDNMVSREETFKAVTAIPNASYFELEDMPHPLLKVSPELLSQKVRSCLED